MSAQPAVACNPSVSGIILAGIFDPLVFRFIHAARLRNVYGDHPFDRCGHWIPDDNRGLSSALGTFLAGVVLANSEFRHELESDIEPFKGLLLGLFFITVGAGINFDILFGKAKFWR